MRQRITATEFLDWLQFIQQEEEQQTKMDYYLAQIATEVRRGLVANPNTVKVSDFLISYGPAPVPPESRPAASKAAWAAALNVKLN